MLVSLFGGGIEDPDSEAFVASFIAGLFLTHRRMASISQEGEAVSNIMIEDLWPSITSFPEVLDAVEALMASDAEGLEGQSTGSEHRMEAIAERARRAEEREQRRQAKVEAQQAAVEAAEATEARENLSEHDWLAE